MTAPVITNLTESTVIGSNLLVSDLAKTYIDHLDASSVNDQNGPLTFIASVINKGLSLDGAFQRGRNLPVLSSAGGSFTLSFWLNLPSGQTGKPLVIIGDEASNISIGLRVYNWTTGKLWVQLRGGPSNSKLVSTVDDLPLNQNILCTVVWDNAVSSNLPQLYINGVFKAVIVSSSDNFTVSNCAGKTGSIGFKYTSGVPSNYTTSVFDELSFSDESPWSALDVLSYYESSHVYINDDYHIPFSSTQNIINLDQNLIEADIVTVYNKDGNFSSLFTPSIPLPPPTQKPRAPDFFQKVEDYNKNLVLLIEAFQDSPRIKGIIEGFNQTANEIEAALFEVRDLFWLDNDFNPSNIATGIQLDIIGKIFSVERNGSSDDDYRLEIKQRASATLSGSPEDVIQGILTLYNATIVKYVPTYDEELASFVVITDGNITQTALNALAPAGVGAYSGNYIISEEDGDFLIGEDGSRLLGKSI